ncbi:unnamed protein product [Pleuronectes platessa]|uniref:Uncharacterized protein n=1 Tax=Pleuronectes platessa TaxID=8262 RepID=A0A9N7TJC4_PLEPL|nr:unnamed protein product [Pleuronectes platessa]
MEVSKAFNLDDDMVDGDLGDGVGVRGSSSSTNKKNQSFAALSETLLPQAELLRRSSQAGETAWIAGMKTAKTYQGSDWRVPHCEIHPQAEQELPSASASGHHNGRQTGMKSWTK